MSFTKVHTLIIGSGASGLAAAVSLKQENINDLMIISEHLPIRDASSIASDKQSYYKLSNYADESDSPDAMAATLTHHGSMHGDIALVEAAGSNPAFYKLLNLGVPFPTDQYNQIIGFKAPGESLRRVSSCGLHTSSLVCQKLRAEVDRMKIPFINNKVVVKLLVKKDAEGQRRTYGVILLNCSENEEKNSENEYEIILCENIIFAVGGPAGLYPNAIYPKHQIGGIGLAMEIGAQSRNLPIFQFGLACIDTIHWNVSGPFLQVIPRFISTAADGVSDEEEFLRPYFNSVGEMNSMIFSKGQNWAFVADKVKGSGLIDLAVEYEIKVKGRRVFLDYKNNSNGFSFSDLSNEAYSFLSKHIAIEGTPYTRLESINSNAARLFREHGIFLSSKKIEVAICVKHNNGGLAANIWYESNNIKHLFPLGEVNGAHGLSCPNGSWMNSGQVGALRSARYIANRYRQDQSFDIAQAENDAAEILERIKSFMTRSGETTSWQTERTILQKRMAQAGGIIRSQSEVEKALEETRLQLLKLWKNGGNNQTGIDALETLRNLQLLIAQEVYLSAILHEIKSHTGSRGSSITLDYNGIPINPHFPPEWNMEPENISFRRKVLISRNYKTIFQSGEEHNCIDNHWFDCRPIPKSNEWFDALWESQQSRKIFDYSCNDC